MTPAVTFADGNRVANLTLTVSVGPHVSVVFTGDPLPGDTRNALVPIEREGSADEDLLEDSSNRIEVYCAARAIATPGRRIRARKSDGELRITFAVQRRDRSIASAASRFRAPARSACPICGPACGPAPGSRLPMRTSMPTSSALESAYRGRGFAAARVQADPQAAAGDGRRRADPGRGQHSRHARASARWSATVRIEGNASIPESDLRPLLTLQPGAPYFDAQLRRDIDAIELQYANRGYRSATVQAQPDFTADRAQANLVFVVREGPRVFVDHVLIAGNVRTSAQTIERELQLKPGDPLSLEAEYESQRRLAALQLFRRAPQLTELRHGDETRRDLLVTVEEAAPTTLGYGGGVEGRLRVVDSEVEGGRRRRSSNSRHGRSSISGRRNLFGKNRSVNLFASVSLHPRDLSSSSRVGYEFTEYRVLATFREPRLFDTATSMAC